MIDLPREAGMGWQRAALVQIRLLSLTAGEIKGNYLPGSPQAGRREARVSLPDWLHC